MPTVPTASQTDEPEDLNRPASVAPTEAELHYAMPSEDKRHDPYLALRNRNYQLFSLGWMISVVGNQVTAAAMAWEIYDRLYPTGPNRAKLALGFVAGIQAVPVIALALPAGALADRFSRRVIVRIFSILVALCAVGLAYFSYRPGSVPIMYGLLLLYATALSLGRPARSAIVPTLVPTSAYSNAITWNASIFQIASMSGPALAGFVIHYSLATRFHSLAIAYLIDAAGAVFFAAITFWLRPLPQPPVAQDPNRSRLQELFAGIHFVRDNKVILATITLDLFAVLLGGAVYLLPVFAKDVLHVDARGFGWLRAADAVGAFTMAFAMAHLPPMKHAGRAMLLAVAAFGAATIVFGLSRNFWLTLAALFVIGACDNISVVVRHTLVQVLTPDHMRGRVSAVNAIFIGASNELGGLESGLTAAWLGPVKSVVFGGIGTILTVVAVAFAFPQVKRIGRLDQVKPEQTSA